jgi:hypothetical protein
MYAIESIQKQTKEPILKAHVHNVGEQALRFSAVPYEKN